MTNNFVADLVAYALKIVVVLGISIIVWTLVVGTDGVNGRSVLKQNIWNGVSTAYSNLLIEKTDNYGYAYGNRTTVVWNMCDAVSVRDRHSPQA